MAEIMGLELLNLARRCEKATAPDRGLDLEIGVAACGWVVNTEYHIVETGGEVFGLHSDTPGNMYPAFTGNIDYSRTLLPWDRHPCATFNTRTVQSGSGQFYCWAEFTWPSSEFQGRARTEPLATCASALRAIQRTREDMAPYDTARRKV